MKTVPNKSNKKKESYAMEIATTPASGLKKATKTNGLNATKNGRNFETRFVPRYEEIPQMPEGLPTPSFSESSNKILEERYLLKGSSGEVAETVEERFWRMAYDIASADFDFNHTKEEVLEVACNFYSLMVKQEFLPNSPTIMNAGKQNQLQYSACFVLPVDDSLPEIFDAIKYAALIHQTGGGTGFAFSRLRPNGSRVNRSGGVASGPVSFLRVFNAATEAIKQGGTRRGANMGILRIDHPDVLEFIRCKAELDDNHKPIYEEISPFLPEEVRGYFKTKLLDTQISNFNISCAVTDRFMEAYKKGEAYELIDPKTKEVVGTLNAKEVMDEIVERAWHTGDPGLIFIDRINNSAANPVPELEMIESTNPCGEQPLAPWDACNLGSINLGKFARELDDGGFGVDWEGLRGCVRKAVHFLDDVVQANPYTLEQIYEEVHRNRRIGLGVMGFADMLFKLQIAYDSDEAIELAEKVMKFINEEGHQKSEELASERGPFPNWAHSIYREGKPLRNSTVTTIAPTGTISIIGDCSSGIEPVFALAYIHKAKSVGNQYRILTIANKTFTEIAQRENFYSDDLAQKVMEHGSVKGVSEVPEKWQGVFITAPEIDSTWHIKMQAAFQKYTDNGVSKTINLPNSATIEDVKKAYLLAWETGCKGITVYRDGSKSVQVLNVSSVKRGVREQTEALVDINPSQDTIIHRPMVLRGRTYKVQTPVGEGFITINRDESDQPLEVFVTVGKGGTHTLADAEAIGRLVSLSLRLSRNMGENGPKEIADKIISQLKGIGGASHVGFGKDRVMSLADAIAKALAEDLALAPDKNSGEPIPLNITEEELSVSKSDDVVNTPLFGAMSGADLCPECGDASFVREDGCQKCYSCGYSKC